MFPSFNTGLTNYRDPYDPTQFDFEGMPMPKVPTAAPVPSPTTSTGQILGQTAVGAGSGAATGALAGSAAGPGGAVIGAGIGALTTLLHGLFSAGAQREQQVRAAKVDAEKRRYDTQIDAVNQGVQNQRNAFASMMDAYRGATR